MQTEESVNAQMNQSATEAWTRGVESGWFSVALLRGAVFSTFTVFLPCGLRYSVLLLFL